MISKFRTIDSKTHSGTFPVQATGGCVSRPHDVALQASGLERGNGRLGAKAAGLERATLQADGFCTKSTVVALQACGLERDTARPRDSELRHSPVVSLLQPQSIHRPCAIKPNSFARGFEPRTGYHNHPVPPPASAQLFRSRPSINVSCNPHPPPKPQIIAPTTPVKVGWARRPGTPQAI